MSIGKTAALGLFFGLMSLAPVGAQAAQILVSGSGSWEQSVSTTVFSAPGENWSFAFDVADPTPGVLSSTGFDISSVSSIKYFLDDVPVPTTFSNVKFYNAANGGGFDINWNEGTFSVYGDDVGGNGTLSLKTYNVAVDVNDLNAPAGSGTGIVTLSETTVPEPATWTLLVMGFFGSGYLLRRRSAVLAA